MRRMADPKRTRECRVGRRFLPLLNLTGCEARIEESDWKILSIIKKIQIFISEVRTEMQKVNWATREELIGSTTVVLMTMFIISSFIGVADFILSYFLAVLLR